MQFPVYTALAAGFIVLLQMGLMLLTVSNRYKYKQGLGDGGHPELLASIRCHGNLIENAPIILIVLGLLEMSGLDPIIIGIAAALFVIARILHPIGLRKSDGTTMPRLVGVLITTVIGVVGGLALVYISLERLMT